MKRTSTAAIAISCLSFGCAPVNSNIPKVFATGETEPVGSLDDAADDPAIWINPVDAQASLILGTDKRAGLYVYNLDGDVQQFLEVGRVNNVDLRQNVKIGEWSGDVAAASNRTGDVVTLFTITDGVVSHSGSFQSGIAEPYGVCMGAVGEDVFVFVTHKTGEVVVYQLTGVDRASEVHRLSFESQLEGCVYDDEMSTLYIGEENRGIWKSSYSGGDFTTPSLVDVIGAESGLKADVEGLALYKSGPESGYLIASSQGNNSYALYRREGDNAFVTRFAVASRAEVDGAEETDGIEASSVNLGPNFPNGILVVQDGYNAPKGSAQNFKIVDWRDVERLIAQSADTEN
ncbi:phytase [Hyphococcus sp. DH-69]|uniref:phytase n=1 Tax=Hyphococcus formosus TaxID=3143534 RepID=UPI00398B1F4A